MVSTFVVTHGDDLYYSGYVAFVDILVCPQLRGLSQVDCKKRNSRGFLKEDELEKYIRDCGYSYSWPLPLWLLVVMAATIVGTHGHGRYYCGFPWSWPLLLWLLMVMVSTIVASQGHGIYYCGYSWS